MVIIFITCLSLSIHMMITQGSTDKQLRSYNLTSSTPSQKKTHMRVLTRTCILTSITSRTTMMMQSSTLIYRALVLTVTQRRHLINCMLIFDNKSEHAIALYYTVLQRRGQGMQRHCPQSTWKNLCSYSLRTMVIQQPMQYRKLGLPDLQTPKISHSLYLQSWPTPS